MGSHYPLHSVNPASRRRSYQSWNDLFIRTPFLTLITLIIWVPLPFRSKLSQESAEANIESSDFFFFFLLFQARIEVRHPINNNVVQMNKMSSGGISRTGR